jgi:hypothetical protein
MTDWQAGLTDDDDTLRQFHSAANPLDQMGIDPDEARANPSLLDKLRTQGQSKPDTDRAVATATAPPPPPATAPQPKKDATLPPAPQTSAQQPATDEEGYGRQGLETLTQYGKKAGEAAESVPTQTPEEINRLTGQREKLAMPAPRYDPATGKPLKTTQEYDPDTGKMVDVNPQASLGSKIWRGVRGGLVGLATGGIPGAIVGGLEPQDIKGGQAYNAPSKQYERAEQRREQALGATDTSIENARKNWEEVVKARQAQASEYGKVAALGKDAVVGAKDLINAEATKPTSPEAKLELTQKEFAQRQQQLQTDPNLARLSPLQKSLYMANGKVPDPKETTEGDIQAANMARAMVVWKNSHKGQMPQTVEEFNQMVASARGELNKGTGNTEAVKRDLERINDKKNDGIKAALANYSKNPYGVKALPAYQQELTLAQNTYEQDMERNGTPVPHMEVSVDKSGQVTWKPAAPAVAAPAQPAPAGGPQPAQPAATPAAQPQPKPATVPRTNKPLVQPGDTIKFNGKDEKVTEVRRNPQTDKYAYNIGGKWYTDDDRKPTK